MQRIKVQHEIVQYIKRVQHGKSATWKNYYRKNWNMEMVLYEKKCNMIRVQHEKSATWKIINCHGEIRKKCTNRTSVDGPLYIGNVWSSVCDQNVEWQNMKIAKYIKIILLHKWLSNQSYLSEKSLNVLFPFKVLGRAKINCWNKSYNSGSLTLLRF